MCTQGDPRPDAGTKLQLVGRAVKACAQSQNPSATNAGGCVLLRLGRAGHSSDTRADDCPHLAFGLIAAGGDEAE